MTIHNIDYDDNVDDNNNDNNTICETVTVSTPILLVSNAFHPNNNNDIHDDYDDDDDDDGVLVRSLDHNFDNEQVFHLSAKQLQYDNIDITVSKQQPTISSSNNNNNNNSTYYDNNSSNNKKDGQQDAEYDNGDNNALGQMIIPGEYDDTNSFLVEESTIPKEIGLTTFNSPEDDEYTLNSENVTGSILDELSQILKQHKSNGSNNGSGSNKNNKNLINTVDDSSTVSSTIRATHTNVKEIKVECNNTGTSYIIQEVVSTCIEQEQTVCNTIPSTKDDNNNIDTIVDSTSTSKGFLFNSFLFTMILVSIASSVYFGFTSYQKSQLVRHSLDSSMLNVLNDLLQNQSNYIHNHSHHHNMYNKSTPSHQNNYNSTRHNSSNYNKGEGQNFYLFIFGCILFVIIKLMVKGDDNKETSTVVNREDKQSSTASMVKYEMDNVSSDDEHQVMIKPEPISSISSTYTTPSKQMLSTYTTPSKQMLTCYDNLVVLHSSCQKTLSRSGKASRKKKKQSSSSSSALRNGTIGTSTKEQSKFLFEHLNLQSYDKLCKDDLITILHWFTQENNDSNASTGTVTGTNSQYKHNQRQQYKISDMKTKLIYDLVQIYYNALYGLSKDELLRLLQYSKGGTKFIGISLTKSMLIDILLERGF